MNSDPTTAEGTPSQTEQTAPTRTRRSRRAASTTSPEIEAVATTVETNAGEPPAETTTARRRGRAATATSTAPAETPRPARGRGVSATTAQATEAPVTDVAAAITPAAEAPSPLTAPEETAPAESADEAAPARSRRRRGRGGRAAESAAEAPRAVETAIAPLSDESQALPVEVALPSAQETEESEALATEAGVTAGTGRRRRRRGRGGRGAQEGLAVEAEAEVAEAEAIGAEVTETPEGAEAVSVVESAPAPRIELTPAVLRRFDHRDWRERPGRAHAPRRGEPYTRPSAAAEGQPAPRGVEAPVRGPEAAPQVAASSTPASAPAPVPSTPAPAPVPFERGGRGRRFSERPPAQAASEPAAVPMTAPPLAPFDAPAARSMVAPVRPSAPAIATTPEGGTIEERLERLISGQAALLQQQQQALQSMTTALTALQGAIERMSTQGIAAGMPRAGMFVDAPNVVYAAENARVSLDYGRMLDFLGRGREMVHAIVYAPVTEDTGYRMENQRFVAPFMNKGYKMVTKPLKRFPDGTAKGNFDIELAIDIVTMSQRLDVVILISGDSDFSRLIELIQSRGVRVEVVAFASNVSWELVQMADVFIDIGQYVDEFRAR